MVSVKSTELLTTDEIYCLYVAGKSILTIKQNRDNNYYHLLNATRKLEDALEIPEEYRFNAA